MDEPCLHITRIVSSAYISRSDIEFPHRLKFLKNIVNTKTFENILTKIGTKPFLQLKLALV